jgi:hypothetical protein
MKWINRFFILFLGIILSITTGFGIAAFYPQPVAPIYPSSLYKTDVVPKSCYSTPQEQASAACQRLIEKQKGLEQSDALRYEQYESDLKTYENSNAGYTRTAIFFGIVIGAFFAIVGIGIRKISRIVATGLLLAGVLTAILTRLLIGLASLGAVTTGTSAATAISYIEFGVLLILSIAVVLVGLFSLKEQSNSASIPAK